MHFGASLFCASAAQVPASRSAPRGARLSGTSRFPKSGFLGPPGRAKEAVGWTRGPCSPSGRLGDSDHAATVLNPQLQPRRRGPQGAAVVGPGLELAFPGPTGLNGVATDSGASAPRPESTKFHGSDLRGWGSARVTSNVSSALPRTRTANFSPASECRSISRTREKNSEPSRPPGRQGPVIKYTKGSVRFTRTRDHTLDFSIRNSELLTTGPDSQCAPVVKTLKFTTSTSEEPAAQNDSWTRRLEDEKRPLHPE